MDPYEFHELHDRWDALMVRMLRLFSKLNIRVTEDSCGLDDRAEIVKLLYHHAWVETNLKKIEPMQDNLYHNERVKVRERKCYGTQYSCGKVYTTAKSLLLFSDKKVSCKLT